MLRADPPHHVIASAHQPHLLPWLRYLNKVANSDVFLWLDSVQYRKNYFQNRTRILGTDRQVHWLTIPVHARLGLPIRDVVIADDRWKDRLQKRVEQSYRKAPHFADCWPPLRAAIADASDLLNDVNYRLFQGVLRLLTLDQVRLVRAGECPVSAGDPTERLVQLCKTVGADHYIAGQGARAYMRLELFEQANIRVIWQAFDAPRRADHQAEGNRPAELSVVDYLFHAGPRRTRELMLAGWRVPPLP